MNTIIIILSIVIVLTAAGLFAFMKYREYVFNNKSYSELVQMLRRSNQTYNRLSFDNKNSAYGRALYKSIMAIEYRINDLDNA